MIPFAMFKWLKEGRPLEGGAAVATIYAEVEKIMIETTPKAKFNSISVFRNLGKTLDSVKPMICDMQQSNTALGDPQETELFLHILTKLKENLLQVQRDQVGDDGKDKLQYLDDRLKQSFQKYEKIQLALAYKDKTRDYDVFLNFRGTDSRHTIACLLHNALGKANISAYMDERCMPTGKQIPIELEKGINKSLCAITIISENYAESDSCLDELLLIQTRNITHRGYILIPIYYGITPADLTNPKSKFSQALQKHKKIRKKSKVEEWRKALENLANAKGKIFEREMDVFIDKIVEEVKYRLQQEGKTEDNTQIK